MKLGAIDIGSNAVRLLLMDVYETSQGPKFIKNCIYRVPLRLGEEAFINGKFSDEKQEHFLQTMQAFKNLLEVHNTDHYACCATSAMREAKNSDKIIKKVKDSIGIEINVISGDEEADVIFSNNISNLSLEEDTNYLYIDVGGGSTELILLSNHKMIDKQSFNIGTLRIKHEMDEDKEWKKIKSWLQQYKQKYKPIYGIGSGGNINAVLKSFTRSKQDHLSIDIIDTCYRMLKPMTAKEKIVRYGMKPDRADVIVPSLEIFRKVMNWVNMDIIYVPKLGLPDGIIKRLYQDLEKSEKV